MQQTSPTCENVKIFFLNLLIHPNKRAFFPFFSDWGLLSPLASGGKSRLLMAPDTLRTWRNAEEGSIPHVPPPQCSVGRAPRGAEHPDTRGARLLLSLTRHGYVFKYDGFSFSLMGN